MNRILHGSCLCGTVTFEVAEPFLSFLHCHCSRCRKASGSSHASNLRAMPTQFRWTSGQELLTRFDLPSARSFATTFCSRCGAPLPHLTRSGREIIVPAGSLDEEPEIRPQGHSYWDSRAVWTCAAEPDLPRFQGAKDVLS